MPRTKTVNERTAEYTLELIAFQLLQKLLESDDFFIMKVRPTEDGGLVAIIDPGKKYVFAPLDVQIVRAQLHAGAEVPPHPEPSSQAPPPLAPAPAKPKPKRKRKN